jgi:ribosomal protein L33
MEFKKWYSRNGTQETELKNGTQETELKKWNSRNGTQEMELKKWNSRNRTQEMELKKRNSRNGTKEIELKKWNLRNGTQEMEIHRPVVGPSTSGHRSDGIITEQREEADVMKDLGKCRWQWRNRLERVSGGRGTRVS